jgi:beta-lactamase regulating signal transducer with metallopeptidase domain
MITSLAVYVIGNALFALPLAFLAWCTGRALRYPTVTHALWVVVLVRLLLPPIGSPSWLSFQIPTPTPHERIPPVEETVFAAQPRSALSVHKPPISSLDKSVEAQDAFPASVLAGKTLKPSLDSVMNDTSPIDSTKGQPGFMDYAVSLSAQGLLAVWFAGSISLLLLSAYRILQFRRLLQIGAMPAGQTMQSLATDIATSLGRPMDVNILVTMARIPPCVWSLGLRPQIVLPMEILNELPGGERRLVIAHELAHIHRKDHLVRWLEWIAIVWLWWNPLVWIARHGLRIQEELACDALVLEALKPEPREYGGCLVSVAEALSVGIDNPPSLACTMSGGRSLEQRIQLILSHGLTNRPSIFLKGAAVLVAGIALLVGVATNDESLETISPSISATQVIDTTRGDLKEGPFSDDVQSSLPNPSLNTAQQISREQSAGSTTPAFQHNKLTQRPHRTRIDKVVDRVTAIHVQTNDSSIHILRDETIDSVCIAANFEPSSAEISDSEFAADLEAIKFRTDRFQDGRLQISLDCNESTSKLRSNRLIATLTVRVPKLNTVTVTSLNGNVWVNGEVGKLQADTINGDIEIQNIDSSAALKSINGSFKISLADSAINDIEATSINGNISLSFPKSWQGLLDATSSFKDIEITNLPGSVNKMVNAQRYLNTLGQAESAIADLDTINGSILIHRR